MLILSCMIVVSVTAQSAKWDSTFRPNNYELKLAQFRSYPNAATDIIFFGNSITDYTDWNELLQLNEARNRGISGDITFGLLQRLDEVTEGKPAKIFILAGINDIARNIPDEVILNNFVRMIHQIKAASPATKIYINSIFPVNNSFPARNHFNKDEHISFVNAGLEKICMNEGANFINVHPHLLDKEGRLDRKFTYDGLHPTFEGYRKWVVVLQPYIAE